MSNVKYLILNGSYGLGWCSYCYTQEQATFVATYPPIVVALLECQRSDDKEKSELLGYKKRSGTIVPLEGGVLAGFVNDFYIKFDQKPYTCDVDGLYLESVDSDQLVTIKNYDGRESIERYISEIVL